MFIYGVRFDLETFSVNFLMLNSNEKLIKRVVITWSEILHFFDVLKMRKGGLPYENNFRSFYKFVEFINMYFFMSFLFEGFNCKLKNNRLLCNTLN